jgi:hypothetical protein
MLSRTRLDTWGGAFFALIGLAGCGGVSVGDESTAGGTGGSSGKGGSGGTGGSGVGGTGGSTNAGTGGTGVPPEIHGACEVDSQCSPGRKCVDYADGIGCQLGRVCETSLDECGVNADCDSFAGEACMPNEFSVRICKAGGCAVGRPFLIAGAARVAGLAERADWIAPDALSAAEPANAKLGAALSKHWLLAARMEHASIAAFARFGLELLALGAPSDLLLESARAMQDETLHAELCFGLASRYGDNAVGPGPLSLEHAFGVVTLESAMETAVLEGCIGETLAAAEAQAASEHAKDPVVREILERIAADETRHAALAFRFVTWALERGGERIALRLRELVAARRIVAEDASAEELSETDLLEAGVLPARHRADVRRYAYDTIVLRALRALLHEPEYTTHPAAASC